MTIRLNSLSRWKDLEAGAAIMFDDPATENERRIRLHFNLAAATPFYIEDANGPRFLTVVPAGLETVEFGAVGSFAIFPQEGAREVQYQTAEDEPTYATVVDPVIFTKIANRRHRNPEMEEVMFRMQQNMERRLAQQADEIEQALERRRMEETHGRPAERIETNAPGAAANAGGKEQEPVAPKPVEGTGSANDGEQQGNAGTVAPA